MVKTIGVLTSGGDAPGMNAAVRAVVRTAISKGIKVIGIRRGYNGLINGDMYEMDARSVSDIINRGGTILYTARCKKFETEEGLEIAAEKVEALGIDGLVVIGGDGSFRGAADLARHLDKRNREIACIGLPGTIDNDIQCTDYTIGFDTAMNTALDMIDRIRDTSQSHDRCSVIEVMGRHAGHIAVNVAAACGATAVLCEESIPLENREEILRNKLDELARKMMDERKTGKTHFIVVVAEGIGHSEEIAEYLHDKTVEIDKNENGVTDVDNCGIISRATILGHVQRGGNPTLRDRVVATEMGHYAVQLLVDGVKNRVVGMKDNKIVDFDIQEALSMKKGYQKHLEDIVNEISF